MAGTMMDERSLVLLRRKLEALNYTDRLDAASAVLVSKLVEDLVRATDSYRACKLQSTKYAQEISTFNSKVRGIEAPIAAVLDRASSPSTAPPTDAHARAASPPCCCLPTAVRAAEARSLVSITLLRLSMQPPFSSTSSSATARASPTRTARSTAS